MPLQYSQVSSALKCLCRYTISNHAARWFDRAALRARQG